MRISARKSGYRYLVGMDETDERLLAELLGSADAMFAAGDFIAAERAYKSVLSMVSSLTDEDSLERRYCLGRIADSAMHMEKYQDCLRVYNQLLGLQLKIAPFAPDTIAVALKLANAMRLSVGVSAKMILASSGAVLLIGTAVMGASMWIPGASQNTPPKAKATASIPGAKSAKASKIANKQAKKKKRKKRSNKQS